MRLLVDMNLSPRWVNAVFEQVVGAVKQVAGELHVGALLTIDTNRKRLRLLPLQSKG